MCIPWEWSCTNYWPERCRWICAAFFPGDSAKDQRSGCTPPQLARADAGTGFRRAESTNFARRFELGTARRSRCDRPEGARKRSALTYDSPAELAADIGRYLRNQPVVARPASAAYIIRKYVRRHRASVAAGALVLALVASFAIWQGVELRRIRRERDRADRIAQFMTRMFRISDPEQAGATR